MESKVFSPPRRAGVIFHLALSVICLAGGVLALIAAFSRATGVTFVLVLVMALLFFVPLPFLLYRGYSLLRGTYTLERDGLRLRWGLRGQDIPLPEIEWVRPASDLGFALPLPALHWPGAIVGQRSVPDLGPVEFMASGTENLLLLATAEKVYAISPEDVRGFMRLFQRLIEFGSLSPIQSFSSQPAAYARRVWDDRLARVALLAGVLLTGALFLTAALMIPLSGPVSLGFDPSGSPLPPVPPERMMLLPIMAGFVLFVDLILGVYLYRSQELRPVAYLLWISSAVAPLLLLITLFLFT